MKKLTRFFLAGVILFQAAFGAELFAGDDAAQKNGKEAAQMQAYMDKTAPVHNQALDYLEMFGMIGGTYLACRSNLMSKETGYYSNPQAFAMLGTTGLIALTAFAGTIIGGVTGAVAFGPVSPDYMQENKFNQPTRVIMTGFGAAAMAAGGYAGYRLCGNPPQKYGEGILAGSLIGAIVGSYIGYCIGGMIFPDKPDKKKAQNQ